MTNDIIFADKTFPDMLEEIHRNATVKREMINAMIAKLVILVHNPEDAAIIFPIIQHFLDTSVKNDAHIIQIAQIVQKVQSMTIKADGTASGLSETEKQDILKMIQRDMDVMVDESVDEAVKQAEELIEQPKKK